MKRGYASVLLLAGIMLCRELLCAGTVDRSHIAITAQALYTDYERNEIAADQKYKDREINVGGVVQKIGKEKDGTPYVILRCSETSTFSSVPGNVLQSNGVRCVFDMRQTPRL